MLKTVEQWSDKVFVFRTLLVQWLEGCRNGLVWGSWWCTSVKEEAADFSTWWNAFPGHTPRKGFSQPLVGGNHTQRNNWNINLRHFEPGGPWIVSKVKKKFQNWGCVSIVQNVLHMYKVLGLFSSPSQSQIPNADINNEMANFKLSFFKMLGRQMFNIIKIRSGGLKKPASGEGCWEKRLYSHWEMIKSLKFFKTRCGRFCSQG